MKTTILNVRVDGIKVKTCIGELVHPNRLFIETVACFLPDCIMGMVIVSHWGMFPLTGIVRQKACKSTLQAILMGHVKGNHQNCLSRTQQSFDFHPS